MAIIVQTPDPSKLLKDLKKQIDDKKIDTWTYDKDGDFTHVPDQWKLKGWLRPTIASGTLIFGLLGQKEKAMSKVVYGVYHGRFIEMLLTHFDDQFTSSSATAQKESSVDIFK